MLATSLPDTESAENQIQNVIIRSSARDLVEWA
jgi:hypothetical protein